MSEPEHTTNDDDDAAPAEDETHPDFEGSPDAEPEGAPAQDDDQQEASAPLSEKDVEKALKAVERAGTTYRNAIGRALREDAQALLPCPRCNAPVAGMVFPPDLAPVDDETRAAVLASIGEGADAAPPLREAEGVMECDRCNGWGELLYPSRRAHTERQPCPRCGGTGYRAIDEPASNVSPIVTPTTTSGNATVEARVVCSLCGASVVAGEAHWCAPAANASAGA